MVGIVCSALSALVFRSKQGITSQTIFPGLPRSGNNIWKMKYFPGQGKVREFCGWSGKFRKDFESQGNSGNLKINGYGRQSSEKLFILFKREKDVLSHEIVWAHLPPHRGLLIKERICSHGEQILSFKSNPQI